MKTNNKYLTKSYQVLKRSNFFVIRFYKNVNITELHEYF